MDALTPDQTVPIDDVASTCHTTHGYLTDKDRYLVRLKRIEGQV